MVCPEVCTSVLPSSALAFSPLTLPSLERGRGVDVDDSSKAERSWLHSLGTVDQLCVSALTTAHSKIMLLYSPHFCPGRVSPYSKSELTMSSHCDLWLGSEGLRWQWRWEESQMFASILLLSCVTEWPLTTAGEISTLQG